ncbi:hypothetical protein MTP99_000045 [Tenebrio molitor]|nr:hypothetical protein MTP99_000045 [Tenebrio molitor]
MSEIEDNELDPRIQIELEKLNTTTDEINRLEIEYDEANTTFRMLLERNNAGAIESAVQKIQECQKAAVQFQRANGKSKLKFEGLAAETCVGEELMPQLGMETVALAEQRFLSNQHEWQFDNAWQEMLNHATIKFGAIISTVPVEPENITITPGRFMRISL